MRRSASLASTSASVNCEPTSGMSGLCASRYGTAPMWSSWPWVSTIACTSASRSRIGAKSGRIRSTPGCSTSGKSTPQSTMSSLPSYSKTVMLRPMAPRPPSGMTRRPPSRQRRRRIERRRAPGSCGHRLQRAAAAQSARSWASSSAVASTSGGRTGPAGRPCAPRPAFTRIVPWVRKMPVKSGSSRRCSAQGGGDVAALVRLDHVLGQRPAEVGRRADQADPADGEHRQREGVLAGVDGQVAPAEPPPPPGFRAPHPIIVREQDEGSSGSHWNAKRFFCRGDWI